MNEITGFVVGLVTAIILYGAVLGARLLWLFYTDGDKEYNKRYKEFLEQKERVEANMKKRRGRHGT